MESSPLEVEIRSFISQTFLVEFGSTVRPDTDLFEAGLIDSYGFIDLVRFLEKTYDISLSEEDLASAEMSTLVGLAGLVRDRRVAKLESTQEATS